jgi:hypothetical protein
MGASCFVENNFFRNCKYPMLISMQGSDDITGGTFSGEDGGIIKSYGNIIQGQKAFTTYQQNSTDFDAYEASSRNEKIGGDVKAKSGGTSYNNFDTSEIMYKYAPDKAEDVPAIVTAKAGRVDGGDFKWKFDNAVDDEAYAVNKELKAALVEYKDGITAVGSGFKADDTPAPVVTTTEAATTSTTTTTTTATINTSTAMTASETITTAETTTTSAITTVTTTTEVMKQGIEGDSNGDGAVDMSDALLIMQSLANPDKYVIAAENALNADVNGRGNGITSSDALAIQKYLLGLIKTLPES